MSERNQNKRWRCTVVGCNPKMFSIEARDAHVAKTQHRTAKWPIRSPEGKLRQKHRNKAVAYAQRDFGRQSSPHDEDHPHSPEALGQV